jgi:SNF2 family DNA or RNA helicase
MFDESNLHGYQREFADFARSGDASLGLVEMGLGKTASAFTAMSAIEREDRAAGKLRRFLVAAPRRVAVHVWPNEVKKWRHLQHMRVAVAVGSPAQRLRALTDPRAQVVTINYENLEWLLTKFPKGTLPFYGLVLDEVDKMKSPGTKRFKALRHRVHEFSWRLGMTGTFTPESLLNAWAPAYLVTAKPRPRLPGQKGASRVDAILGSSYDDFCSHYFEAKGYFGHKLEPRPGAFEAIGGLLAPITYQARAEDHLDLPELIIQDHVYELEPAVMKQYRQFEADFVLALDKGGTLPDEDEYTETAFAEAANAAVLKNKLRQMCSGFLYHQADGQSVRQTRWLHGQKISAYEDMVSELSGLPHLAVYGYLAEVERLKLDARLGGGISDREEVEILRKWNAGKIRVLGMHPASAGHGLNLHEGGAHHIAFLTLPWSRGLYDQTIARLRRMGQRSSVVVHRFIALGTVEEMVVKALESKGAVQEAVISALRRKHS